MAPRGPNGQVKRHISHLTSPLSSSDKAADMVPKGNYWHSATSEILRATRKDMAAVVAENSGRP